MHPTPYWSPGFSRWDAGRGRGLLLDKLAPAEELESGTGAGASNAPYWSLARTLVHRMHPTPYWSPGFSRWDAGRGRGLLLDKLAPAEELESGTGAGASNAPYTLLESRL